LEAERRNLGHYGYGIKGFMLSMIETALDVTRDTVPSSVVRQILAAGQDMLEHPIDLLPHAREVVTELAATRHVILITKGDLLDQERKIAQSGLGELFEDVQIVSEKSVGTYARIFTRTPGGSTAAMMAGNSMKSDVLPVLATGGWGIHVPHELNWELERAEAPDDHPRYRSISDLGALPGLVADIES